MQNIKIISDIHTDLVNIDQIQEHLNYVLPISPTDKDTILILAGDIFSFGYPLSYESVIAHVKDAFAHIIYISGNHEWYSEVYSSSKKNFVNYIKNIPNFHYLDGTSVIINDVVFIGACLWTNFNDNDKKTKDTAHRYMNDYNYIKKDDGSYITPDDILQIHYEELEKIINLLEKNKDNPRVVVTHHGASLQCIHPQYKNAGLCNYAFTSNLEHLIYKYQPEIWVSGHTHTSHNFSIGKTQYIINPAGYRHRYVNRYENWGFDPDLTVVI